MDLRKTFTFLALLHCPLLWAQLELDHEPNPGPGVVDNTHFEEVILKPGYDFIGEANYKMNAYIDPTQIAPSNYGNLFSSDDFDDYEIDTDLEVGFTPGVHGVSPSGAATYSVPIQLPPGTNGMEPELAISYNSQAGNGLLGMGWNLAGLSVISRTKKNHYFDGKAESIRFDYSDPFTMDGQRLLAIDGANGHNGTIYGTESEGFNRIISHGSSGSGPEWFEVKTKDGKTIEYGTNDNNAVSYGTGSGTIYYWMITKIYDQHGNFIDYKYIKENNEIRIDKIRYTGNFNTSNGSINLEPYNEIQFYYQDREDVATSFLLNHVSKKSVVLRKIRVSSYNSTFRSYNFEYAYKQFSFLTSIQEFGANSNTQLNKTIFEYDVQESTDVVFDNSLRQGLPITPPGPGVSNAPCGAEGHRIVYYPGDFNGDGVTDLLGVRYWINTSSHGGARYISWAIYINNNAHGDGFSCHPLTFPTSWLGNDGEFSPYNPLSNFPVEGFTFHIGDLNGDGIDDIVVGSKMWWNNDLKYYDAHFILNGAYGPYNQLSSQGPISFHDSPNNPHAVTLGDFDGDRRLEFFGVNGTDLNYAITSFNGRVNENGFLYNNQPASNSVSSMGVGPVDFNGDGISSVEVILQNSAVYGWSHRVVAHFETTTSGATQVETSIYETYYYDIIPSSYQMSTINYVDFNGDGNTDAFGKNQSGQYKLRYSKRNNLSLYDSDAFVEYDADFNIWHNDVKIFARDINGDGMTDIVYFRSHDFIQYPTNEIHIHLSTGQPEEFEYYTRTVPFEINHSGYLIDFGDFNGDGNLEMIFKNNFNGAINFVNLNPKASTNDRRLRRVKNGFGHETRFDYKNMASGLVASALGYPVRKVYGSFNVVSNVSSTNALGGFNETEFDFYHPQVHLKGKGFLGFMEQRVTDLQSGMISESEFEWHTEYYINLPKSSTNYLGSISEENIISSASQTFALEDLGNNRFFTKLLGTESEDLLTGIDQSVDYFYDSNFNVILETNTIGEENTIEITETHYSDFYGIDGWHVAPLPREIEVKTTRNSETQLSETTRIEYNLNGTVDQKRSRYNSSYSESVTEYNYGNNPFGLVESTTISGVKPDNIVVDQGELSFSGTETIGQITTDSYVYSDDGRHILEHTDRFGFTTEYTYYNRWGKPKTVTDYQGRQNYFEYDGFGRIKKEVDYLGQVMTTERAFVNDNPVYSSCDSDSDVLYKKTTILPNDRITITKYNALGQVRFKQQAGQFEDLYSSVCYDELGREKEKTTPHFASDANIKIAQVEYDDYGRVFERNLAPVSSSMVYESQVDGHLTTLVSNASGTRTSKTDLTGRIVQTTDPGGILTRTYQSGGLLKKVELNGQQVVENTYDEFGRQVKLDDMNAGATHYNYDSFDNVIFQQDANGNIMETEYDELGRIVERKVKEADVVNNNPPTYDYEYYEDGPEETLLKKETAPSGHATEYTYDDDQNIASITEIIDGQPYTTSFEYDEFGKPTRKEYPSGFAIRYEYDNKDYLERITSDDGQLIIWEITGGNAQGQVTSYNLGNGLAVTKTYDEHFFPAQSMASNGTETVYSFNYDFDPVTSNLKSRNLHGTEEHFFYDTDGKHLNRLAGTGPDENTVSENYAFADNGNITNKAGMGPYIYDSDRKNAVSQVGIPPIGGNQDYLQTIQYNHFNSASVIENLDDQLRINLEYGSDDQRRMAKYWDESDAEAELIKTRIYAGSYEKQTNADLTEIEVHYISAGGQLAAMYVVENGVGSYYYPHLDHLGSIIHITDASGDIVYTQSFDAWGRTRNPNDLSYDNIPERPDWLWRGYTGHEHLDEFGLINMNGRLYDPVVGRMLSPDNYVQNPDFSQSYNRYSYVWNNPLKYTDPSGEVVVAFVPILVAIAKVAAQGAVMGAISYTASVATSYGGFSNFDAGDLLKSATIGAAAAVVSFGVGEGFSALGAGGGAAGGVAKALVHGAAQTGVRAAFGQEVNWGTFATSAISSGVASATHGLDPGLQVMASGVAGGFTSTITGGKFIDGAFQGVIISTMNHLMHDPPQQGSNNPKNSKQDSSGNENTDTEEPWLRIPGPYDQRNWRANWMNLKAGANSVDRVIKNSNAPLHIYEFGKIVSWNVLDVVLWRVIGLPPSTPGMEPNMINSPPPYDHNVPY